MIQEKISDMTLLLSGLPLSALLEIDTGSASYSITVGELLASWGQLSLLNVDTEAFTPGMVLTIPAAGDAKAAQIGGTFAQAFAQGIALANIAEGVSGGVSTYGYVAGFVGLTPGPIWLGAGGSVVSAPPDIPGSYIVPLGRAISASEIIFAPGIPTLYR
jgi:hypothetical protein